MDGNTPLVSSGNFSSTRFSFSENEDLNEDNTLSELESYYEYNIDLIQKLNLGNNNIVDRMIDKSGNATWYQFRIPIRDPDRIQGSISDFKTINLLEHI